MHPPVIGGPREPKASSQWILGLNHELGVHVRRPLPVHAAQPAVWMVTVPAILTHPPGCAAVAECTARKDPRDQRAAKPPGRGLPPGQTAHIGRDVRPWAVANYEHDRADHYGE